MLHHFVVFASTAHDASAKQILPCVCVKAQQTRMRTRGKQQFLRFGRQGCTRQPRVCFCTALPVCTPSLGRRHTSTADAASSRTQAASKRSRARPRTRALRTSAHTSTRAHRSVAPAHSSAAARRRCLVPVLIRRTAVLDDNRDAPYGLPLCGTTRVRRRRPDMARPYHPRARAAASTRARRQPRARTRSRARP